MAGLLDRPGMSPFLVQVGLGLLMSGMPQRRKGMRSQVAAPWLAGGVQSLFPKKDANAELRRRLLEAQAGNAEAKGKSRQDSRIATDKLLERFGVIQPRGAASGKPAVSHQPRPPMPGHRPSPGQVAGAPGGPALPFAPRTPQPPMGQIIGRPPSPGAPAATPPGPGAPSGGLMGMINTPEGFKLLVQSVGVKKAFEMRANLQKNAPKNYQTVQNPYGRGGVGQRETTTGQISSYQAPPTPPKPPKQFGPMQYDPNLQQYYQAGPGGKRHYQRPVTGMEVTTPGGTTIRTGVPTSGPGGMQKSTRGGIEKKLLSANEGYERLKSISATFRPEYQEIGTRWDALVTSWRAKLGGAASVSPEDRKLVTEYATFRRDAFSHMNQYIKDITGAQMSEFEARRLRKAIPDPGDTLFGGDDPISFKAKLDSGMREIEKAKIRYAYYLNKGITGVGEMSKRAPLDTMEIAVNPQTGQRIVRIEGQWQEI